MFQPQNDSTFILNEETDVFFFFNFSVVQVSWNSSTAMQFGEELRNLQALDLTSPADALRTVFSTLNMFRMQYNFDTYGLGRTPWFIEPAVIVHLTDGMAATSLSGVSESISVAAEENAWSQLTTEAFRWDQVAR